MKKPTTTVTIKALDSDLCRALGLPFPMFRAEVVTRRATAYCNYAPCDDNVDGSPSEARVLADYKTNRADFRMVGT